MKSQKAREAEGKTPPPMVTNEPDAAASGSKPTRQVRPSFDDLHGHITARAYALYVQRGCRDGCAVEDWLDAERETVNREFPG